MEMKGKSYIKGHITIANSTEFKRDLLIQFIGAIGKAVHQYTCIKEHAYLAQSHMVRGKYVEKGVDMDDAILSGYEVGKGVRFNAYIEGNNIKDIIKEVEKELNLSSTKEEFDGIQVLFDYHQLSFEDTYHFSHDSVQSSYLVHLKDNYSLALEEVNGFVEANPIDDPVNTLRKHTDFIVISNDYEGSYQLIAEMVYKDRIDFVQNREVLTEHSEQLIDLLSQYLDRRVTTIYKARETNKVLINSFEHLINKTFENKYLIGEEQLVDYFNHIAQMALKGLLSGAITINKE